MRSRGAGLIAAALIAAAACAGRALAAPPPTGAPPAIPDGKTITFPALIPESRVNPEFPEAAKAKRAPGIVVFEAVIRSDGSVGDATAVHAAPPGLGFEAAAKQAVLRWRYRPAEKAGRAVAVRFPVVVEFKLKSGGALLPMPDTSPFWRSCRERGLAALAAGDLAAAERHLRHALTDATFLPATAYQAAVSRKDLAALMLARGSPAEAERLLAEALPALGKLMRDAEPDLRYVLGRLGELRAGRGDAAGALPLLERAARAEESAGSPDPAGLAGILRAQAKALRALGRVPEAEAAEARAESLVPRLAPAGG